MQSLILTLRPLTAFGTLPLGDTLFGQLCWILYERLGNAALETLKEGYTEGKPFAVISDAMPSGYIPRPTVPMSFFRQEQDADRKATKKKTWFKIAELNKPFTEWLSVCEALKIEEEHLQQHNSISRLTNTTGKGNFAPYTQAQYWYRPEVKLDIHIVFDEQRISENQLKSAFEEMGQYGFGRDASIGLGKFELCEIRPHSFHQNPHTNAVLTLAPCSPKGLNFDAENSYYQLFTRFGRHGAQAMSYPVENGASNPFKTPIILAKSGAVFSSEAFSLSTLFTGRGLGGSGQLSKQIPTTIQQGYAPVVPIHFAPQEET